MTRHQRILVGILVLNVAIAVWAMIEVAGNNDWPHVIWAVSAWFLVGAYVEKCSREL